MNATRAAVEIVELLKIRGYGDFSQYRDQIANDLYENGIWQGNWDSSTNLGTVTLRLIQEDEYDQHMDNDPDAPDWDTMVSDVHDGYLWVTANEE